jgi:hypothetical protein
MENIFASGGSALLLVFKVAIIIFLLVYVVFAGIIIKQARMMTDTLEVGFETQVKLVVFLHFLFSLLVLFLAIFIL